MGKSQTCSMSILCALEIEYRQLPRHREDDRIKGSDASSAIRTLIERTT